VSSYNLHTVGISDREWQVPALKMIKRARVPVVPVYFGGTNSKLFHLLGLIHPTLRTARLPSELFNKKKKTIDIRIGNPISVAEQDEFKDISRYGRFLRAKSYALGSAIEIQKFFRPSNSRAVKMEPLVPAVESEKLEQEIGLIKDQYLLFTSGDFQVFCSPSIHIPSIMNELGRLRETTFRKVGE